MSLLTDFGLVDPYVAEMKAVILSICPHAQIIDISHQVDKFNITMGAFLLAEATPYFPNGTVHVAVVDPGVGSSRRAIVIKTPRSVLVGPDNGLLMPSAKTDTILGVYEITNRSFMRQEVSSTFHGRDIFAPAGAHLACGYPPEDCGPEIKDYVESPCSEAVVRTKTAVCEILHIDGFGNVVTNLPQSNFQLLRASSDGKMSLSIGRRRFSAKIVKTFPELNRREIGLIVGSHGFLEIVCREKSAAKRLRVKRGSVVRVSGS
jgi:S-adenosylmethionine hydrolase